jgi:hypothetical protein
MVQQMMPMDIQGTSETVESNRKKIKHIGHLKVDNSKVAIIFRTVPDEPENCLVMGPKFLDNTYHDAFMKALESSEGQDAFELGTHLSKSRFPDGLNMLAFLHENNFIKKMSTESVVVTMGVGNEGSVPLNELNEMIAEERGVSVAELASSGDKKTKKAKPDATKKETKPKSKKK